MAANISNNVIINHVDIFICTHTPHCIENCSSVFENIENIENNENNENNENIPMMCSINSERFTHWRPAYLPTYNELKKAYIKRNNIMKSITNEESIIEFDKHFNFPHSLFPQLYNEDEHFEFENIKNGTIEPPRPDIREFLDPNVQIRIGYIKS